MSGAEASVDRWRRALDPLLADPASAAVLSDLDGTLAPIVARPELVAVPERARSALVRIADRYALCAVITGRRAEVAREIVGLDGIAYAGNHGFEMLQPGGSAAVPSPALAGHLDDVADFVASQTDPDALASSGLRLEDKGPIVALHWRGADDVSEAESAADRIGEAARSRGLVTHEGRKVLELRPAVRIDKGVAIENLLVATPSARRALYAGDDRTDLDGFRALSELRDAASLERVVRVGVRSPEGPAELIESCDLAVDGTGELVELLEALAG